MGNKETNPPKKQKKKQSAENASSKEHKKNWRETYATPEEIEMYLKDHIYLRRNLVTMRTEFREPSSYESDGTELWQPISDWKVNSLWKKMAQEKPVIFDHMRKVINSDCFPDFHPFRFYLEHLPPWDHSSDYILEMSLSVNVKGDAEEQMRFYEYLKKWLVAMVASWIDEGEVNQSVLVLIGEQGIYKTTWFSHLLPPQLRDYFRIKVNSSRVSKDDLITLSQYGLVCYEELDVMRPSDVNTMKSVVTMPSIDERKPFGHYTEHMPHVASFCGTGNNVQFLTDVTGNRRWLPFEVESIISPRDHPFDYEGIYAQAYALYRQDYRHYFTKAEEEKLREHNRTFETPLPEQEAIAKRFRHPAENERGDFYTATEILTAVSDNPALRLNIGKISSAMESLGFVRLTSHGRRGYRVVAYKHEEIEMNRRMLASDAQPEGEDETAGGAGGAT